MSEAAGVDNLRLKFPGAATLLFRHLTLSIGTGQKVLLLGPSGCGKSTLLQVLSGIVPGSVEIPLKYDRITVPDSWGYVFQDPDTQFCMPFVDEELAFVLENLQVPRERMPELMHKYLDQVGLAFADLHTGIQTLSQGMKQRLAIASVLALEPEVLFLDEPTALLDPEGTEQVWETIRRIGIDRTMIIVEHKIERIADLVDRVIVFNDQGEMIADGAAPAIFAEQRAALQEYGIWHPGVWDSFGCFVRADAAPQPPSNGRIAAFAVADRQNSSTDVNAGVSGASLVIAPTAPTAALEMTPLVSLRDFQGYRGKIAKIRVDRARVYPGEWIAVIGENGAGKSTLLLALMQLLRTSGEYLVNGKAPGRTEQLSGELAYVFQNPEFQFVTNSVFAEIAYTLQLARLEPEIVRERVEELLHIFNLAAQRDRHPYQLSLGQKRRLSVAAAIVKEQRVLLLDEPTFGQDAQNTFALLQKLEEWRQRGTAIVMVTHDPEIVRRCATRVWTIAGGRLAQDVPNQAFEPLHAEPQAWTAGRIEPVPVAAVSGETGLNGGAHR